MINLNFLTETQQAEIYKKLCEAALRIYASSQEDLPAAACRNTYSAIIELINPKVRKGKKGLSISIGDYCETVSFNYENTGYRDSISRAINNFDNGTPEGNRRIKSVHSFVNALDLGTTWRMVQRRGKK